MYIYYIFFLAAYTFVRRLGMAAHKTCFEMVFALCSSALSFSTSTDGEDYGNCLVLARRGMLRVYLGIHVWVYFSRTQSLGWGNQPRLAGQRPRRHAFSHGQRTLPCVQVCPTNGAHAVVWAFCFMLANGHRDTLGQALWCSAGIFP